MKITDEQIDRANTVNLPQFLMANGFDLKKVGREYVWKEHDSLRIKDNSPGERGKWFRFSTDEGGDNINFVQQYMGKSFVEAVELLNGESYVRDYVPSHSYDHKPKDSEKVDIVINENDDCKRVFGYLCGTRGLDYDMISELVKSGKIAQEQKTGNVVFKIFDENNKLVGVEKVGTSTEHQFKSIATGSASGYGFEVCKGNGENALFFESSIDMLSYLQMYGSQLENHRLVAMMGVKPSIVLDTMERYGILSENVFLCSDNDKAGNEFAERLIESFPQMKRVFPDSRYKDWNDMLRKILIQKTKEVEKVTTYGNKTWNDATDNRDKSLISMNEDTFMKLKFNLDASGINYFAYTKDEKAVMAVNDKDLDWLKQIAGNESLPTRKSNVEYIPPQKNIIGNAEYRYIPDKQFVSADSDTALKMAEIMLSRNIQFSGRIYPSGKATLTVSGADLEHVNAIQQSVVDMRKQFARETKADEVIGNKAYRDIRQRQFFYSKLNPEQYKEVQPFLDTNAQYSGLIRDNKVIFTVEKEDSAAFHRALENAQREVGIIHALKENGIDDYRLEKLSAVIHRFAVEDIHESLDSFFTSQLTEQQFDKMLSLVNDYLAQSVSERYGEYSGLNDILDFKNEIDRSTELAEFFSEHSFSDEQKSVISEMFAKDSSKNNVEVLDETFTPNEIREYYDILHNQLESGDVADFLNSHRQANADCLRFTFGKSENKVITAFSESHPDSSFALANAVMMYVGKDLTERRKTANLQEQSDYTQKCSFEVSAQISGEPYSFSGAVFVSDDKENPVIEWIRSFSEDIIEKGGSPVADSKEESLKTAQRNLATLVPFLESNLQLTAEEQQIFDDFVADYEKYATELTDKEKAFMDGDIVPFMTKSILAWDEIESISYRLYEDGYIDKFAPHDNTLYGNGMRETTLYELAHRMQDGEDIRKDMSKALLGNQHSFITKHNNEFTVEYGENSVIASYGNAQREIRYEDLGDSFFKLFKDEYNDIVHGRTVEDLRSVFPDITDETADKLINAFDSATMHGWKNNKVIQRRIKKALYGILGDEENTEKAFASIADMKYNFKVEPKQVDSLSSAVDKDSTTFDAMRQKSTDSLAFTFDRDSDGWFTESELLYDFVAKNPDVSFALANAVVEYLDEKKHFERNIPELNAGWYDKTDFNISAIINGEDFGYEGRFDIGDGNGTGGGSIIDHIRLYNESIVERGGSPFAEDKAQSLENAQRTLDIFIPFLEKNSQLTAEEQQIFNDFKAQNPIRTFEDYAAEQGYFHIFQLKDGVNAEDISQPNNDDYDRIYTGRMVDIPNDDKLEGIFAKFNWNPQPVGFHGHNLTDSDVVVTDVKGELTAFYRKNGEFVEMPDFFKERETPVKSEQIAEKQDLGPVTMRKVGDFYEMYGKNAQIATDILGLHLTTKNGSDMVGFPDSVKEEYADKLRDEGYSVLIEESFEINPPKRQEELISDVSEIADFVPDESVAPLTIVFNGERDSLDTIKNQALSLGATCTLIASGLVVDTYENHKDELLSAADELGLESKIRGAENTPEISVDDDVPLFAESDVIEEIEKSEKASDKKSFLDTPAYSGEQLSLFGEETPKTAEKVEVSDGLFVGNVNRFTALHNEIMRGTGFQGGKFRVKQFYDEKKPTNKEFADFLKNEYGTGGHSGNDDISFVDHDSKGMFFTLNTGEKFKFTWSDVAEMTSATIDKGEYITQSDIDRRISDAQYTIKHTNPDSALDSERRKLEMAHKILQEYGIETADEPVKDESSNTIEVGDKFRNKHTGEISEVISLNGALPWITEDCTVQRESGGFAITENIPYAKLFDKTVYERVEKENIVAENPEVSEEISDKITFEVLGGGKLAFKDSTMQTLADIDMSDGKISYFSEDLSDKDKAQINKRAEGFKVRETAEKPTQSEWFLHSSINREGIVSGSIGRMKDAEMGIIGKNMEYCSSIFADDNANGFNIAFANSLVEQLNNNGITDISQAKALVDSAIAERENALGLERDVSLLDAMDNDVSEQRSSNFTITDDSLGNGGAKAKFNNNVAAIETLKTLELENRPATDEEKQILSKYVGWGGIAQAFDKENKTWESEYTQLKELLTDSEYTAARASVLDAFYTSPTVIDGIYEALANFGFEGGNVLEPAMGVGNFFGRMPEDMRADSKLYGVEIDSISGRIAQKLYPDADIAVKGFEKNNFQNGCFDVAVGNVPFGELPFKDDKHGTSKLHDYFFAETLDNVSVNYG